MSKGPMQIVEYQISNTRPAEYNPRQLSETQFKELKESMEKFGPQEPAIINTHEGRQGIIISGHQRMKIAESLGFSVYPCIEVDLIESEERELNIRMNKNTGSWDFDILANEFDMPDLMDWGFTEDELVGFGTGEGGEGSGRADPGPKLPPKDPKTKLGQIYQLGNHRLMCADALNQDDINSLMLESIADMCFTSPPYNVGNLSQISSSVENQTKYLEDEDKNEDYEGFLKSFTEMAMSYSKYFFCNMQMLAKNKMDIVHWLSYYADYLSETLIWDKGFGQPAMAKNVCNSAFEFVFVFAEGGKRTIGTREFRGDIPNIFQISANTANEFADVHAAVFPLELPVFFIEKFTNEDELVLDIFGGTGTTLIACEQTGRICRMMELDPGYCDVVVERYCSLKGFSADKVFETGIAE